MRLGQAAALKIGSGSAQAGVAFDGTGVDAFAHIQAKVNRGMYGYLDANARWENHKKAVYAISGGLGASW